MKVVAVVQARMQSTRLPGKILMDLAGKPVLRWVYDAAKAAHGVDEVVVATSTQRADDIVQDYCEQHGMNFVRGSEDDVISRFVLAMRETDADALIRLTADCPFHDPDVIAAVVRLFRDRTGARYVSNTNPPTWPDGLDTEVFTGQILEEADYYATRKTDRDCVTRYMIRNGGTTNENLTCPIPGLVKERWVLDTENDLRFCRAIADRIGSDKPASYLKILSVLDKEPELREINKMHPRNERFYEGINTEDLGVYDYTNSVDQLDEARKLIPLGCQTFSKSYLQFPDKAPYFLSFGDGAYCNDIDGNEYVDCVGGLLPLILGYRDPDVDAAIRHQLDFGITFSLATELELDLADRISTFIPSMEMMRFGKNGSDVTSVAVRLSRALTNRGLIISSGYHGWSDCFVGDFNDSQRGVPPPVRELTTQVNRLDVDQTVGLIRTGWYACIILEPETRQGLKEIREACTETGTILIFDEIITWPRWGMGGAQELYGVTPDLTCISKAIGNGMPISAIGGRRDIMKQMEPPNHIFYSGTFQGEALSLAAAIACIKKLDCECVIDKIKAYNFSLNNKMLDLSMKYTPQAIISFLDGLTRIDFKDTDGASKEEIATLFRQTMAANGVLIINANGLGYMHREPELKRIVRAYERSFQTIQEAIEKGDIKKRIGGRTIASSANIRKAVQD